LGLNTFIKRDDNGRYIFARGVRIALEDKPVASQKAIVCRGTTCYRGRRIDSTEWEYVVKFTWPSDKRQREGELLKLTKENFRLLLKNYILCKSRKLLTQIESPSLCSVPLISAGLRPCSSPSDSYSIALAAPALCHGNASVNRLWMSCQGS
jgi:hypothetical protein